ncbi:UNVERIFIED_ORG: hypothetical protein LHK14_13925 [Roseateles sp. XES5]|uniref:hypothetical protein n=1 Tax=Shinella sp. G-2 TaxID=3133141 RepID=UPI001D0193E8|nr:hypothetical protein [Roseateles sp. XES5]
MSDAVQDAVRTGSGPHSPETMRTDRDLPHAYIVEEARLKQAGTIYHLAAHQTKPEEFQSSACFDAWAKDDDAA